MVGHFRSHIPGTNINESTLLASDYLNHFHELVMLLEALASDPDDFATDLAAWRPLTYEEHFEASGFRDKNLAIAAYRRAPEAVRRDFDAAVAELHSEAVELIAKVSEELNSGPRSQLVPYCQEAGARLRVLIGQANSIAVGANGHIPTATNGASAKPADSDGADGANGQDAIDALLDPR